jgi:hypothetical protein
MGLPRSRLWLSLLIFLVVDVAVAAFKRATTKTPIGQAD